MIPEEHFSVYVVPAFRQYTAAEEALTLVVQSRGDISTAEAEAMRSAMAIATPAWHLADWMWVQFKTADTARVLGAASLADYRREVQTRWCRIMRGQQRTRDLEI